jgi:hypothetical protein
LQTSADANSILAEWFSFDIVVELVLEAITSIDLDLSSTPPSALSSIKFHLGSSSFQRK